MLRLLAALAFLALSASASAQDQPKTARHSAYLEVMGNAGIASLNVDYLVTERAGFRVGGFAWPWPEQERGPFGGSTRRDEDVTATILVLVMAYQLVGPPRHRLELGDGLFASASVDPGSRGRAPRSRSVSGSSPSRTTSASEQA